MVEHYSALGFNDTWNNWFHSVMTYDDNHNILTSCQQSWYEDEWFATLRWTNEYDSKGRIITQTYENRPTGAETWTKGTRVEWAYDEAGNMVKHLFTRWDEKSGKYVPSTGNYYSFDENGNMLTNEQQRGKKIIRFSRIIFDCRSAPGRYLIPVPL